MLLIFMDAKTAVPVFLVLMFINGMFLLRKKDADVQWKHIRRLLIGGALGVPIGITCLKNLSSQTITLGVNICVLTFAVLYLAGIKSHFKKEHPLAEIVTGLSSGILSGSGGLGGPPVVIYGVLKDWKKDLFRSSMLVYFVIMGLFTNISLVLMKMHSAETVRMILAALFPAFFASWLGEQMKKKADEPLFRRVVLAVIIATSLIGTGRQLLLAWSSKPQGSINNPAHANRIFTKLHKLEGDAPSSARH
jgi:uncharacterized membrane protein YfcA